MAILTDPQTTDGAGAGTDAGSQVTLTRRLIRLARHLDTRTAQALAPFGLSSAGFATLAALAQRGAQTPSLLCEVTGLTSGAMTHRVDRLEEAGLLERRAAPEDRRSVRLHLTAAGRRLLEQALPACEEAAATVLGVLGAGERDQLEELTDKLERGPHQRDPQHD